MSERNRCLRCGACCRGLIIEAYWHDVLREPRLLDAKTNPTGLTPEDLAGGDKCIILVFPCPFLGEDNLCVIYSTRPNACVGFEPGSQQCRELCPERRSKEALVPKDERR